MNCKCGIEIPQKRIDLGYKSCVNCSTESRWSIVPVNYHKTGNTAEIIKDPEVAADFLFLSQRKSFGVLRGMTSARRKPTNTIKTETKPRIKEKPYNPVLSVVDRHMPKYEFEEVGTESMEILETKGIEASLKHIEESLNTRRIFKKQAEQLTEIIKQWKEN
jgi:hypothetical protein